MTHPSHKAETQGRGIIASVVASVLFGAVYFIPAALEGMTDAEVVSWRIVVTVPFMAVLLLAIRSWASVTDAWARLRAKPWQVLVLVLNAALLGLQLWLFAWAPMSGHGLDVALGYLLMPLTMVIVGVLLHGERLSGVRTAAVIAAVIGVGAAFFTSGGLSWATFAVALGYPIYFTIRRAFGVDTPGAMWIELVVLLIPCLWFAVGPGASGGERPWLMLIAFGAISAVALTLYIVASRFLSFSLFGLLSYVEPIVLVFVALLLLGEAIEPSEYVTYAGIGLAVLLLVVEGVLVGRRERRRFGDAPLPPA
ncbi:EamA family transporter RarD [Salinibacterium sp. dk2585]|uniref:EamA family transporter RarD n=1 Tax=unclassified Salinibacterium TaxID=2632331 RepID=UPI0011C2497D|nr:MULTISPECIES: EamA family transporter RarD [unclassified Salinibacterium]QEE60769.1 EamA family transporter RarD [Salinibacterium sp. dk2585]TXK55841.1 EamA family transporter RarD [Salinibacterium sp. dk5596]